MVGIWWAWDLRNRGGRPPDDISGLAVLVLVTAFVILVWGVIDGIRGPVSRAALTWLATVLCLTFAPLIIALVVQREAPGGLDPFFFILVGGLLLLMALLPAMVGAVLGSGLRWVTQMVV